MSALLAEIRDDEDAKRDLAEALRPYLVTGQDDGTPDRLLSVTDKAAQLGLHQDTLMRMAREGRIWGTKVGREWRFGAGDLPHTRHRAEDHAGVASGTRRRPSSTPTSVTAIRGR
jgi:excisionase family DNA binding protein